MVAAVTELVSQLPTEVGATVASAAAALESQLPTEVGMTTTAVTTYESQLPNEVGWNATGANSELVSQLCVEVAFRGRPQQREMRAWTFNLNGHSYYVLHLEDEGTLVYDQTTQQWADWRSQTFENLNGPWRARYGWNWGVDLVAGDDNAGLLWNLRTDVYQDESPNANYDNYPVNAILTGGLPQRLRDSTPVNGVMLTYSAGYPIGSPARVLLETSDDQGFSYDSQGYVTLTSSKVQEAQWLSLGQITEPLRIFRISDSGIARIDSLDMW